MVASKFAAIFLSALFFALSAHADFTSLYSGKVEDSKVGRVEYTVVDIADPPIMPYRLTVSVYCTNKTSVPGNVRPYRGQVLKNEAVCDFRKPEFNEKTKVLTIHYSTSEYSPGAAKCNTDWAQEFSLVDLCP